MLSPYLPSHSANADWSDGLSVGPYDSARTQSGPVPRSKRPPKRKCTQPPNDDGGGSADGGADVRTELRGVPVSKHISSYRGTETATAHSPPVIAVGTVPAVSEPRKSVSDLELLIDGAVGEIEIKGEEAKTKKVKGKPGTLGKPGTMGKPGKPIIMDTAPSFKSDTGTIGTIRQWEGREGAAREGIQPLTT